MCHRFARDESLCAFAFVSSMHDQASVQVRLIFKVIRAQIRGLQYSLHRDQGHQKYSLNFLIETVTTFRRWQIITSFQLLYLILLRFFLKSSRPYLPPRAFSHGPTVKPQYGKASSGRMQTSPFIHGVKIQRKSLGSASLPVQIMVPSIGTVGSLQHP
jgi:hypothetical protein